MIITFCGHTQVSNEPRLKERLSEIVVAYVEHAFGGAYQTLRHAQRKNKKIINLGPLL